MADVKGGGMDRALMKQLLIRSMKEPVHCAVGQAKDGTALLMLDKIKQPKAIEKELEKANPGVKNTRFGMARVDEEADPKLVTIRLNKAVSGLGRKLVKTLKGTGFTKVQLSYEDGTPDEVMSDDEEAPPEATAAAPPAAEEPVAGGEAAAEAPQEAEAAPPPAPAAEDPPDAAASANEAAPEAAAEPPPAMADAAPESAAAEGAAPAEKPDMGPLTAQLTGLVKRMMPLIAADASRLDVLKGLATLAQAAVKAGDMQNCQQAVTALEDAVVGFERAPPASPAGSGGQVQADVATLTKARTAWVATRTRVDAELEKLVGAIKDSYKDHGALEQIEKTVREKLDTVLDTLDESLAHKLDEVAQAAPAERPKLVLEAKKILQRFQTHLENDKVLGSLDDNPFVPIAVHKTISATVAALTRSVH